MFIDQNTLNAISPLWAIIVPLAIFSLSMSVTPGPNNIMLASSGARFGVKKTLPHYFGIPIGFVSVLMASAYGLGWVFEQLPMAQTVLKYGSLAYLLYLSVKIMISKIPNKDKAEDSKSRPMFMWEAMLFQVVNPKAFVMTTTTVSTFALPGDMYFSSILVMCATFLITGPLGMGGWMFLGTIMGKMLKNPVVLECLMF